MKRDMDLIRKLLLYLESKPDDHLDENVEIEGYESVVINHQLVLLAKAGFINFEATRSSSNPDRLIRVYPSTLTWEGHEFLDAARDQTVWDRVKDELGERITGVSFEVMKALLIEYIRKQLLGDQ